MMSRWIVMVNVPEGSALYIYFYACVNAAFPWRFLLDHPSRAKPTKMEKLKKPFCSLCSPRGCRLVNRRTGRFPFCVRETSSCANHAWRNCFLSRVLFFRLPEKSNASLYFRRRDTVLFPRCLWPSIFFFLFCINFKMYECVNYFV